MPNATFIAPLATKVVMHREKAGLAQDTRRRDRIAGRRAAAKAVARHCSVSPAEVRVVGRSGASPLALLRNEDSSWQTLPVSISISHHDGCGLAAVADRPTQIGVDLARLGEIEPEHQRYFLAPSEWSVAERIGATQVWALKEAAWKALSLSPETPFSALELVIDDEYKLCGLRLEGCWISATGRTWRYSRTLIAAVVCIAQAVE